MKPRSAKPGARTSAPEVTNVSLHGFWLMVDGHERFVDFARFPWFREAPVRAIFSVRRPRVTHLHRPDLDVDLELDTLADPERYPLVSRTSAPTAREREPRRRAPSVPRVPRAVAKASRSRRGAKRTGR